MINEMFLSDIQLLCNKEEYTSALKLLDSNGENFSGNPYYCFWHGFVLYCLHRENDALPLFEKAQKLGLEAVDETPGYYPKSVSKWVERARIWSPRRIEKNAFEAERRAKRCKSPLNEGLLTAVLADLWNNGDYSLEKYVGHAPTDADISEIETVLSYRLPESYKCLIKHQNGGLLLKNRFQNPLQRNWTQNTLNINSIYGIDRAKPYSLCGSRGSKFWVDEWNYPDIGIAICDTETGGHDMIFLDYSDCGNLGEPCVVHVNQESDYEITYLADNFASFIQGLVSSDEV